jgi:DNA polymerase III delta subunit
MVENTSDAMRTECGRLFLFLDKDKPATVHDIESILSKTREESVFTLFHAVTEITKSGFERSLEIIASLLAAKEECGVILGGVLSSFYRLRDYLFLAATNREAADRSVASPTARADYSAASKIFNMEKCEAAIALCVEFQMKRRTYAEAPEKVIAEWFLCKLRELGQR